MGCRARVYGWFLAALARAGTLAMMAVSVVLLALEQIPLGTGYAVWTGIGAVGTAIVGIVAFNESRDVMRLLFIGLIVAGIVGLKIVSTE